MCPGCFCGAGASWVWGASFLPVCGKIALYSLLAKLQAVMGETSSGAGQTGRGEPLPCPCLVLWLPWGSLH